MFYYDITIQNTYADHNVVNIARIVMLYGPVLDLCTGVGPGETMTLFAVPRVSGLRVEVTGCCVGLGIT